LSKGPEEAPQGTGAGVLVGVGVKGVTVPVGVKVGVTAKVGVRVGVKVGLGVLVGEQIMLKETLLELAVPPLQPALAMLVTGAHQLLG
jgi:hypothetical protein